jgi:hypothetical protein
MELKVKIVKETSLDKLMDKINEHIDKVWTLSPGSIFIDHNDLGTKIYCREVQRKRDTRKLLHD